MKKQIIINFVYRTAEQLIASYLKLRNKWKRVSYQSFSVKGNSAFKYGWFKVSNA